MKSSSVPTTKSSFLSMRKDASTIVYKMLGNNELKKLLYYPIKEYHSMPDLTQEQSFSLINRNIRLVPKILEEEDIESFVIISFDNFETNLTNPEYRDNVISFDIFCRFDTWNLGDFKLRPYCIAGEIDAMFNNQHLSGLGDLYFLGANQIIINDKIGGLSLMYQTIHGNEDKLV